MEETVCEPTYNKHYIGHKDEVTALSFHPDSNQLISSSLDKTIIKWHLDGRSAYKFFAHSSSVFDVCYAPNGELMASASKDRTVRIWVPKIKGKSSEIKNLGVMRSVQFSPDGQNVILAFN